MTDPHNPNMSWPNRPPPGGQMTPGFPPQQGPRPPFPGSGAMQMKGGQPMPNGPTVGQGPSTSMFRPPSSGVNGFPAPAPVSTGPQTNTQFNRPPGPGPTNMPMFRNGQDGAGGPPNQFNQMGQPPRPGMPPSPGTMGQVRPPNFASRPPGPGVPPSINAGHAMPGAPPRLPPVSIQGVPPSSMGYQPPSSSQANFGPPPPGPVRPQMPGPPTQDRPNELPMPFHGEAQYKHQVGMTLTPGITPANSGPPSQKSSRTNSPAVVNQNFDALEGQFRGTPDQEHSGLQPAQPGMAPVPTMPGPTPGHGMPGSSPGQSMQGPSPGQGMPGFPPGPGQSMQGPSPGQGMPGFPPGQGQQRFAAPPTSSQAPGFQPGMPSMPPTSSFAAPPSTGTGQFPPQLNMMSQQRPGFPPPPVSSNQQPPQGFPPMSTPNQRPGFPPSQPGIPPSSGAGIRPGFPPASTANQVPGFPPPPSSTNQFQGGQPSANHQPGFPPPPSSQSQFPPMGNQNPQYSQSGKTVQDFVNTGPRPSAASMMNSMQANFNNMSVQGGENINLLQEKKLIPPEGVETSKPTIPNDTRNINCSPEVFRCTMNAIPQTSQLLNKSRLPLGILIHPFKDLSQLPVIQSSVIVRCRSCRTYINPFVYFVDSRRWKCNLCYRMNDLPDEFSFDPVTKTYGDPQRRPEIRSATIEFIAPSEYMLRPPQPAVYLYLIDVSFNAIETGYLSVFCETLLDVLDRIPGDSRTQIGFIAYDSAVHYFNLEEGLSQPQMLTVSDVDDIFLPCPDNLLVNLNESRSLVIDLLSQLPTLFENNMETRSALGAALQAAFKMMSSTGGRVSVMQSVLPTYGPGGLQNREDNTQKTSKDISNLGPATDFYKKLALDCSAQQIAVDVFMFNGQYADMASIECISKFSGGCTYYYPSYHAVRTPHLTERFESDLRRYFTRKLGLESVMRIRCSKGLNIHTFHGNFFVRSTDLLSLPNVNPDAGFGMQMSIDEPLTDMSTMCFQAALLYTSSKGERRIRVHTLCLPVTNQLSDLYAAADQQAIVALLAKMAVDRSLSSSMSDAREAIVNAAIDILNAYKASMPASQRTSMVINKPLRLIPLYCLALLKSIAFRTGISTRLDDRNYALQQCKVLPVRQLIQMLHPDLYPLHTIMDVEMKKKGQLEFPALPLLQLSSANIDRFGAYLLDRGETLYLYVGSAINQQFCKDILGVSDFSAIKEGGIKELPELDNEGSERLRAFITYLLDNRPNGAALSVIRDDGKLRMQFFQQFIEDRTESSFSYVEFLQQVQQQLKS